MRFNDRAMALIGVPDLPIDAFKKEGGKIKLHGGGGGPTTSYTQTSNIPEYAQPYVERMMGATEKQVYTYNPKGDITGFQPYKSYKEATGQETVAPFSPAQQQAMSGIMNYQMPGQTQAATGLTGAATMGSMGAGQQYAAQATNPYATQAYMSPYIQGALEPQMQEAARQSAIQGQQNAAQAVQAGAFGGSRFGVQEAERQRNLGTLQNQIYGQGMQNAFQQAQQAQQFGSQLGLQGMGQALQGAGQLGALGQQQYQQELGLMGQQMGVGEKQQQYQQALLNQAIQDYATKQQYPFIQLGTLSNMLRGLPMQASTTQMYQAQPSLLQQGIGAAGAYANLSQAGVFGKAEGGEIKEMAVGGIASGVSPYELPSMMKKLSDQQLQQKLDAKDTDPETMGIAQAEKQRRDKTRGMAHGGIVAFADGSKDAIDLKDTPWGKDEAAPAAAPAPKPAPKPVPKARVAAPADPYEAATKQYVTGGESPEIGQMRNIIATQQKEADLGVEGQMARKQALEKKYGIDVEAMLNKQRADREEEMKLSREDARKAEHLRWAQMFAKFGSTPGPILKAALTSINEGIPDLLDDQAKTRAAQKEIRKAMDDLDKSELLYKQGKVEEAEKSHQAAAGKLTDLTFAFNKAMHDERSNKAKVAAGITEANIRGRYGVQEAAIRAAGTGGGDGSKQTKEERLREQAIDKAYKDETKGLQEKLSRWKSAPEAVQQKNAATIKALEDTLKNKRAEIEARYKKEGAAAPVPAPSAGEVKFTDPKAAKYFEQYK